MLVKTVLAACMLATAHGLLDGASHRPRGSSIRHPRRPSRSRSAAADEQGSAPAHESQSAAKHMEEEIFKMINVANTDHSQRGNMADFAKIMMDQITSMKTHLQTSHSSAQQIVNTHDKSFQDCTTAKTAAESASSTGASERTTASSTHKTCRSTEATDHQTYKQCESARVALESSKTAMCNSWDTWRKQTPSADLLPKTTGLTFRQWVNAVGEWAKNQEAEAQRLDSGCTKLTTDLAAKAEECQGADGSGGFKKTWEDQKQECDSAQTALESAACAAASASLDACTDYNTCYEAAKTAWDSDEVSLKSQEESFKESYWMLERLRCYVQVIIDAGAGDIQAADINKCKSEQHDSSSMDLTWFTVPAEPAGTCTADGTAPCSADYVAEEYDGISTDAPVADCTPCPSSGGGGGASAAEVKSFIAGGGGEAKRCTMDEASKEWSCKKALLGGLSNGMKKDEWLVDLAPTGEIMLWARHRGLLFECPNNGGGAWVTCTPHLQTAIDAIIKRQGSYANSDCFKILPNGDALICDNRDYKVIRCSKSSNTCATVAGGNGKGTGLNQLTEISGVGLFENGDYVVGDKWPASRVLRCPADGSGNCEVVVSEQASRSLDVGPTGDIFLNQGDKIMKCPPPALGATSTCSSVGKPPQYSEWISVSPRNEPWGMDHNQAPHFIWQCRDGSCENVVTQEAWKPHYFRPISIAFLP